MTALLIVALHGRSLAQSARRGGHEAHVVDIYNDSDTRAYAARSVKAAQNDGVFDMQALPAVVREFCPPPMALLVGSGFEANPALLARLARGRALYGNSARTVSGLKDAASFFPLLDSLDIPHPEISLAPPARLQGWLAKEVGGHGGFHIHSAARSAGATALVYYQRLRPGRSCSALFLANGERARIVGFNEQFAVNLRGAPYCYAGAINRTPMLHGVRCEIARKLDRLVAASGLVGLNSLDFITAGEEYWVLEVNPRPSATLDLYDADFPTGLVDWHLRACLGQLPESSPVGKVRGHRVIYAPRGLRLNLRMRFPEWCSDVPDADNDFAPGMPVCTVHAEGDTAADVSRLLDQRRAGIEKSIFERAA
jgi:predicted ATP-grasp superfamily ATP-dependent carboligase